MHFKTFCSDLKTFNALICVSGELRLLKTFLKPRNPGISLELNVFIDIYRQIDISYFRQHAVRFMIKTRNKTYKYISTYPIKFERIKQVGIQIRYLGIKKQCYF